MQVKMIVRVHPDDRVEVKVEGLTERDMSLPKPQKLCKKITRRLEQDLGGVTKCEYADDWTAGNLIELSEEDDLELGN